MKDSIVNMLEDFEKLAYKLVLWIILIPKTIIKITLNPRGMRDYVYQELDDKDSSFDKYISPLFLYLGVTLLPIVLLYFIPEFGVKLASPDDDPNLYFQNNYKIDKRSGSFTDEIESSSIQFSAEADLIADANVQFHQFTWNIWGCGNLIEDVCQFDDYIYGEIHNEQTDGAVKLDKNNKDKIPEQKEWESRNDNGAIEVIDKNTVRDTFLHDFPEVYELYKIEVIASNFTSDYKKFIEEYTAEFYIYIPGVSGNVYYLNNYQKPKGERLSLSERFKSGSTIVLGLVLLLPPLLFALVMNFLKARNGAADDPDLKKNFYIQCYYFSPLALAFWGLYYISSFYTSDIPVGKTLFLPLALALVWFVVVETNVFADALSSNNKRMAFFVLTGSVVVIALLIILILVLFGNNDILRRFAIWAYIASGLLLTVSAIFPPLRRWWKNRTARRDELPPSDFQTPADG